MSGGESGLVSVLMVTHDAGRFLAEAVASVRAQTHPWKELVLVDNASADGSVEAVRREWGERPGLTVIRSEVNLGPAGGACLGLPACRGEFVARLDADDVARPDRLAVQANFLRSRPDLGAVGSDAWCIDDVGRPLRPRLALRTDFLRRFGAGWESACPHSSLMFRRTEAEARFYNPTLGASEDFEWIEWLARRGRLGLVREPLVYYRMHDESLGATRASYHRVAGGVVRARIARAGRDPGRREALGHEDLSWIARDERIVMPPTERARAFLAEAKTEGNWLAAAYFSTIAARWWEFPSCAVKGWRAGVGRKWVLALLLVRTVWPVWKRAHALGWSLGRGTAVGRGQGEDGGPRSGGRDEG